MIPHNNYKAPAPPRRLGRFIVWTFAVALAAVVPLLVKRGCRASLEFDPVKARTNSTETIYPPLH